MPEVSATIQVNTDRAITELLRVVIDNTPLLQASLEAYAATDLYGASQRYWSLILEPFLYDGITDWQRQMFLPVWSANVQDLIVELMKEYL